MGKGGKTEDGRRLPSNLNSIEQVLARPIGCNACERKRYLGDNIPMRPAVLDNGTSIQDTGR